MQGRPTAAHGRVDVGPAVDEPPDEVQLALARCLDQDRPA